VYDCSYSLYSHNFVFAYIIISWLHSNGSCIYSFKKRLCSSVIYINLRVAYVFYIRTLYSCIVRCTLYAGSYRPTGTKNLQIQQRTSKPIFIMQTVNAIIREISSSFLPFKKCLKIDLLMCFFLKKTKHYTFIL